MDSTDKTGLAAIFQAGFKAVDPETTVKCHSSG